MDLSSGILFLLLFFIIIFLILFFYFIPIGLWITAIAARVHIGLGVWWGCVCGKYLRH